MIRAAALASLLGLAACTTGALPIPLGRGGGAGCEAARVVDLVNASSLAVEQAYAGNGAPDGWGPDLLLARGGAVVPSRGTAPLPLPAGTAAVRAVWVNGRAAELPLAEACGARRILLRDDAMQAE